jgi:ADP-heptose:LPS heptosyltransferase
VGYANTGGAYLLTDVVPLDERVSWVEQNLRAVDVAVGGSRVAAKPSPPPLSQHPSPLVASLLTGSERDFARRLLENLKLHERRPLVGIHPSGGRTVKQWPVERWAEVAARLQRERGATVVVTGSEADRPLAAELTRGLPARALDFSGRLDVRETLALLEQLDLFLSPDTGPMHMATTVGTPSVSVFGPSDPVRYFSGGQGAPGSRHVVVRRDLWCSPCNLIRRPPVECSGPAAPDCLHLVTVDDVFAAAVRVLEDTGHGLPRPSAPAPERV